MDIRPLFTKVDKWLSEKEVIDILIDSKLETGKPGQNHFFNVVTSPIDLHEFFEYQGLYIARTILREEMGFYPTSKPGDFDVILIPYSKERVFFERTAVFEVKVVRPTRRKPGKNANSLGITQLKGLIEDGFPLVSLMHVCMTEPLLDHEKVILPLATKALDMDNPLNNEGVMESFVDTKFDHFAWYSADNQMKRLITQDIPKYAGISCLGLSCCDDGTYSFNTCSYNLAHYSDGYFNPYTKEDTIEKIKAHFTKYPEKYVRKELKG